MCSHLPPCRAMHRGKGCWPGRQGLHRLSVWDGPIGLRAAQSNGPQLVVYTESACTSWQCLFIKIDVAHDHPVRGNPFRRQHLLQLILCGGASENPRSLQVKGDLLAGVLGQFIWGKERAVAVVID